jgi:hypothetical protein
MKKILLLFSAVGLLSFTSSCTNDDDSYYEDSDTIAEVFEVSNVDFSTNDVVNSVVIPLNPSIYTSDMVLVYRLAPDMSTNVDVWEPLPTTYNFNDGGILSYYFDFSINDVVVYLESNFDATGDVDFTQNQVFRVLIIPAYQSARLSADSAVDLKDYNAVVKKYGIKESNVKQISLK